MLLVFCLVVYAFMLFLGVVMFSLWVFCISQRDCRWRSFL